MTRVRPGFALVLLLLSMLPCAAPFASCELAVMFGRAGGSHLPRQLDGSQVETSASPARVAQVRDVSARQPLSSAGAAGVTAAPGPSLTAGEIAGLPLPIPHLRI